MGVKNTNPSTYFGGTWVALGTGKVPVGANANDTNFATVEKTGGASTVTLTTAQIPSHTHAKGMLATASAGGHTHDLKNQKNSWSTSGGNRVLIDATSGYSAVSNKTTTSAGSHSHTISGSTAAAGSGSAHNNLQPYITCYMWKRTVSYLSANLHASLCIKGRPLSNGTFFIDGIKFFSSSIIAVSISYLFIIITPFPNSNLDSHLRYIDLQVLAYHSQ